MTSPTVLISGAGIAGPSLAFWLTRNGYRVVVVELVMRPFIAKCQDLPNGIDGYLPKSTSDIAITAAVMKWMEPWPFRTIAEKKWFQTADSIDLPRYATD
jgi:flavin-dependent dehydrogenase